MKQLRPRLGQGPAWGPTVCPPSHPAHSPALPICTASLVSLPWSTDFSFLCMLAFFLSSASPPSALLRGCISMAAAPSCCLAAGGRAHMCTHRHAQTHRHAHTQVSLQGGDAGPHPACLGECGEIPTSLPGPLHGRHRSLEMGVVSCLFPRDTATRATACLGPGIQDTAGSDKALPWTPSRSGLEAPLGLLPVTCWFFPHSNKTQAWALPSGP